MDSEICEKFLASIDSISNCWNWTGFTDKSGLPIIRVGGRTHFKEYSARRISLEISGKIIGRSDRVQPLICKNKLCVNPSHLVSGDESRFWAKVQRLSEDDCWIWTASQDKDMYGKFRIFESGKKIDIRAHQYSWQLFSGRPVPPGIKVCHTCDHPYCVNPKHLFLGTNQDNMDDMVQKDRQAKGKLIGSSKLDEVKVKEIRELYSTGNYTQQQLSDLFTVSRSVIGAIVRRDIWHHVL